MATVALDPLPTDEDRPAIVDLPDEDPEHTLHTLIDGEGIDERLEALPRFEADVIRKRFGLDDAEPMTLQEIGQEYALSRERIRQIEKRALDRMRRAWH